MNKVLYIILTGLLVCAFLSGCSNDNKFLPDGVVFDELTNEYRLAYDPGILDEVNAREELLSTGWSEEDLDRAAVGGITPERLYNETRFHEYTDKIYNSLPIGLSGETILPDYYGGLFFSDEGILTVTVLEDAFKHAASSTAIAEMLELGIIIRTAFFTDSELNSAINKLNNIGEIINKAGATSWGLDTAANRVFVDIDPYTDEQIAALLDIVQDNSIDSAMLDIRPAVSQDMRDARLAAITEAYQSHDNHGLLVSDIEISRTGISFSLENRTDAEYQHGSRWDLAHYSYGSWIPVQYLPGAGGGVWSGELYILQSGELREYSIDWSWYFGELPPGKYMFVRDGWLSDWHQDVESVFVIAEFDIED